MSDGSGLVRDKDEKEEVPGLSQTVTRGNEDDEVPEVKKAEKDNDKTVESGQSEYGTFEPAAEPGEKADLGDIWVEFAYENPQEFLKIIIDDFSGLRLIQALLTGAGVGLAKGSMNKEGDHAAQVLGGFAGVSVFCNLLGIVLAFAVTVQCSGMRSFRASGDEVVAVVPKLFKLFYVTMVSFLGGMICLGCAVLILLSTSQTWLMTIFMCLMAASFLAIFFYVMTAYKFGNSLPTEAAALAFNHIGSYDLESAQRGFHSVGGAAHAGVSAAHGAATRKEGDGSEDAPEGTAKAGAPKGETSAVQEKSEETTKAAGSAKPDDKAGQEEDEEAEEAAALAQ